MKYVLLALATLTLLSCEKDEKFLTSGTWTIEKVIIAGNEIPDGETKVEFGDNGRYTYNGVDAGTYLINDDKIYFGSRDGVRIEIKRKSMIIYSEVTIGAGDPVFEGAKTYLVK